MGNFLGGSAPAMARQIMEGYTLVNAVMLKRLTTQELDTLLFEMEKLLRDTRGEIVDLTDLEAIQKKNRKVSRLQNSVRVLKASKQERLRHG